MQNSSEKQILFSSLHSFLNETALLNLIFDYCQGYVFGGVKFQNLKLLHDYCSNVLQRAPIEYQPGQRDFHVLHDIFKRKNDYQSMEFERIRIQKVNRKAACFYAKVVNVTEFIFINHRLCLKLNP